MWGYTIAAAELGIVHNVLRDLQCEPGALSRLGADYVNKYYIHHYTYGSEYKLSGDPQGVNQIGEWSLDKRHYGGAYPPRNLQLPPDKGHSKVNYPPRWLTMAWNEASAGIPDWPDTKALGTVGWRREPATMEDIRYGDGLRVGMHTLVPGLTALESPPPPVPLQQLPTGHRTLGNGMEVGWHSGPRF